MKGCILVFGMPRSGTTWVGKLFDSHPDTLYRHEPDSVHRLSLPLFPEKQDAPQYRGELEQFVAALPYMRSSKVVGKQPLFPKSYQSTAALVAYRVSVMAANAVGHIKPNFPSPYRPTAKGSSQVHLVWKSIESDGRLGVCIEALPDVRAVYLMRHPCGYVASILRGEAAGHFGDSMPSANDLGLLQMLLATPGGKTHGLHLNDIWQLTPEERLAWFWVLTQEKILVDVEGCERVLPLRYEDVCADPMGVTRRMFEFVGLNWQEQTAEFVRTSTQATDTDYYSVFKGSRMSAERWRSELAAPVVERILRILRSSRVYRFYAEAATVQSVLPDAAA